MKNLKIILSLRKLKNRIYVNKDLKKSLRSSFIEEHGVKTFKLRKGLILTAVICILLMMTTTLLLNRKTYVSAEALKVENYTSFIDLGEMGKVAVNEYKGTLYMILFGRGIYTYNDKGLTKLYEGGVNSGSLSKDGKKYAFSIDGAIKIYDIPTGKVSEVIEGDNKTTFYEEPAWKDDNHTLFYTEVVIGGTEEQPTVKHSIYSIDINDLKSAEITEGTYPSYVNGRDAIVFQSENEHVIYKSLKDNTEKDLGDGSQPSASPDGNYVALTRTERTLKEVEKNVKIETNLQNIWVIDLNNTAIKKKITNNYPLKTIDEEEWLKGITPSNEEQILSYGGRYWYLYPSWNSDSKSIYSMKRIFNSDNKRDEGRLIKISLSNKELSGNDIVERYLKNISSMDEDYLNSLVDTNFKDEDLNIYKLKGYNILSSGKDTAGQYVDAAINLASKDNSADKVQNVRYYLLMRGGTYIILGKKILNEVEVSSNKLGIYLNSNGQKSKIISLLDIPQKYLEGKANTFDEVAYSKVNETIYFTMKADENNTKKISILNVFAYNLNTKQLMQLDNIKNKEGKLNANTLSLDYTGKYIVLNYSITEGNAFKNISNLYETDSKAKKTLNEIIGAYKSESSISAYWEGKSIIFKSNSYGQYAWYRYTPDKGEVTIR
ncbi:hypothetical protein [Candidatus Clostridium stratigraminis]|uniref:Uncharacterized protein n=1 Tax=Candidatus Clostridium stratigraminis TaxID=3381661 RepID=A0ABW8T792_9CLOT